MITIDPQISDYINLAIERQRVIFNGDMYVRFKEQDKKLDAKFKEQDSSIAAKFKEQDIKMNVRFKEQEEKIDIRLREQDSRMDAKFKGQDTNIDSKLNIFNVDSERHMGMLLEKFQDRLQIVKEWIKDLPTREEVRTMIQDETNPIRRDLALFKVEIINLRKVSNNHDIRIVRLEQKTA